VSGSGRIIDGDFVLLVTASALHGQGKLHSSDGTPLVVATVMSNLGFVRAMEREGIRVLQADVGDRAVLEAMDANRIALGGEQSGHVIFRGTATTGDGLLTAIRVLEVVARSGRDLDELTRDFVVYPQLLVNVKVKERKPLDQLPAVREEIRRAEDSFGEQGRVLVRFSGTEPLARVMVEGPSLPEVQKFAHRIAAAIQSELGGTS
jgi:phosphoglucosamine mutase